jgi:hypothetical protein
MVALKFMRSFEQFTCEIRSRTSLAVQRDHVVGIITHYGGGDKEVIRPFALFWLFYVYRVIYMLRGIWFTVHVQNIAINGCCCNASFIVTFLSTDAS